MEKYKLQGKEENKFSKNLLIFKIIFTVDVCADSGAITTGAGVDIFN